MALFIYFPKKLSRFYMRRFISLQPSSTLSFLITWKLDHIIFKYLELLFHLRLNVSAPLRIKKLLLARLTLVHPKKSMGRYYHQSKVSKLLRSRRLLCFYLPENGIIHILNCCRTLY